MKYREWSAFGTTTTLVGTSSADDVLHILYYDNSRLAACQVMQC